MPWKKLRTTSGRQKVVMVPRPGVFFGKILPEVNSSAVEDHVKKKKKKSVMASARWLIQKAAAETSGSPLGKTQRGQTGTPEG